MSQTPLTTREVNRPRPHDSGPQHVAGSALYVDDIQAPAGTLHACSGWRRWVARRSRRWTSMLSTPRRAWST